MEAVKPSVSDLASRITATTDIQLVQMALEAMRDETRFIGLATFAIDAFARIQQRLPK